MIRTNKYLLVILSLIIFHTAIAQSKRGNIGIFGDGVALDFNASPPSVYILPKPSLVIFRTDEGSASICDNEGNLLFYTNGVAVWNRNHMPMPHNQGLYGSDWSLTTTQDIIVPIPKDPFQYYIITPGWQGKAMTYSLVDMRLDKGMGDVVFENKLLFEKSTEKVTIVKHASGKSLWLITHEYGTNTFRSYLIDEDGIQIDYVESSVGLIHKENFEFSYPVYVYGTNAIGYLKPSHDGNFLACAINGEMGTLELFKFDKATGKVSVPLELLNDPLQGSYGVEFSPDNTKLYASCNNKNLYQFDLSSGNPTTISNSKTLISTSTIGALQLGPDGKIYCVSSYNTSFLDRINSPNSSGAACDYEKEALHFEPKTVWMGLPELTYNTVNPEVIYDGYCIGQPTTFHLIKIKEFKSIEWDFGDTASGLKNSSSDISPSHIYSSPGYYKLKAIITFADNSVFNYSQRISILQPPKISLGKDTAICKNYQFILHSQHDPIPLDYTWNDGSTNSFIDARTGGQYWIKVDDGMCTASDTINVNIIQTPTLLLNDTTLCFGQNITVALPPVYQYAWDDGNSNSTRTFNSPGRYSVQGTNQCGNSQAKLNLSYLSILNPNLPSDTLLCIGQVLQIDTTNTNAEILWQDGSQATSNTIKTAGIYWVQISNRCEIVKDSVDVGIIPFPELTLKDTTLCIGQTISVTLPMTYQYLWNDGKKSSERTLSSSGKYTVKGTNQCGIRQAELNLAFMPMLNVNLPSDTLICFGKTLPLNAASAQAKYRWQDNSSKPTYIISTSGKYWVEVYNHCESVTDTINIEYPSDRNYFIPNVITPNEDDRNDYFEIEGIIPYTMLTIMNRWGEIIYSSTNYKNEWNAPDLSSGTYYYILKDKCAQKEMKGWLSVLK
jgi:gliding motility-associated-like protein